MRAPGHAAKRAAERHGLEPTVQDLAQAAADIARGEGTRVWLAPTGCEHWQVMLCGKLVTVVYDPATTNIVTVLSGTATATLADVMPEKLRRMGR